MSDEIVAELITINEEWEESRLMSQLLREMVKERRRLIAQGRAQEALTNGHMIEKARQEVLQVFPDYGKEMPRRYLTADGREVEKPSF